MNNLRLAGALALASVLVAAASASPIYIEDNTGNLGTITTAGVYTNIGTTNDPNGAPVVLGDIAVTAGGALYGTSYFGSATELYSINTSNGSLTLIGATGAGASQTAGLTFNGAGALFGNDGTNLVQINTTTGAETVVGNMGTFTDGDFTFDNLGTMYMTGGGGNLYTVDPSTGTSTLVGSLGVTGIFGMVYSQSGGGLYGFGFDNNVYSINQATGAATLVAPFTGTPASWGGTYGADTAPTSVPALPAAIPMLIGLTRAISRRRRKA